MVVIVVYSLYFGQGGWDGRFRRTRGISVVFGCFHVVGVQKFAW